MLDSQLQNFTTCCDENKVKTADTKTKKQEMDSIKVDVDRMSIGAQRIWSGLGISKPLLKVTSPEVKA